MGKVNKIKCEYCGADYKDNISACPYCGSTNIKGAEIEYMNKLKKIKADVENINEIHEKTRKDKLQKIYKKLLKWIIIPAIILLALVAIPKVYDYITFYKTDENIKDDIKFKYEEMPKLDKLYKEQKYEEIIAYFDKIYDENIEYHTWEHYDFIYSYEDIMLIEEIKKQDTITEDNYITIIILYSSIEKTQLDEEEKNILKAYQEQTFILLNNKFGITNEDITKINESNYDTETIKQIIRNNKERSDE